MLWRIRNSNYLPKSYSFLFPEFNLEILFRRFLKNPPQIHGEWDWGSDTPSPILPSLRWERTQGSSKPREHLEQLPQLRVFQQVTGQYGHSVPVYVRTWFPKPADASYSPLINKRLASRATTRKTSLLSNPADVFSPLTSWAQPSTPFILIASQCYQTLSFFPNYFFLLSPQSILDFIKPAYIKMPRAVLLSPQHKELVLLLSQENKQNTYPAHHCNCPSVSTLLGSLDEYCFMPPSAMQFC